MGIQQETFNTPKEITHDFNELARIAGDAARIKPPLFFSSIFGKPSSWLPPYHPLSEYKIINIWRLPRTIQYLLNITIPSIPLNPPSFGPPFLNSLFWRPSVILQRPDHNGSYTTFPKEAWFFINGILTNDAVAQINAALIASLFHRPVTLLQNSTSSLITDLLECALGKQWHRTTEAVEKAFPLIHQALKSEKEKVVVIAHSQGTIIASVVLQLLEALMQPVSARPELAPFAAPRGYAGPVFIFPEEYDLDPQDFAAPTQDELAKLEMYCFANCATTLKYLHPDRAVPWIESFGNEFDIVARLGMLAPRAQEWHVEIDGPRYVHRRAWGHLLNAHYLPDIERQQKVRYRPGGKGGSAPYELLNAGQFPDHTPQLFNYINGGT